MYYVFLGLGLGLVFEARFCLVRTGSVSWFGALRPDERRGDSASDGVALAHRHWRVDNWGTFCRGWDLTVASLSLDGLITSKGAMVMTDCVVQSNRDSVPLTVACVRGAGRHACLWDCVRNKHCLPKH